jgi:TM2 domain-containing membrane protein YozV
MFCRSCAKEVPDQAVMCVGCGSPPRAGTKFCWNCAGETTPPAVACVKCGVGLGPAPAPADARSKLVAGLLGVFLGGFGVHRFYLGYTTIGVIQLVLGVFGGLITCGYGYSVAHLWGLVEGILILTGNINQDAQGRPLKE